MLDLQQDETGGHCADSDRGQKLKEYKKGQWIKKGILHPPVHTENVAKSVDLVGIVNKCHSWRESLLLNPIFFFLETRL